MRVVLYMPRHVMDRCFSDHDLRRLAATHAVATPAPTDPAEALADLWHRHAPVCEALVTGWDTPPIDDAMLDRAANLRVWVHAAGSVKHLLPESFWSRAIALASCRDALAVSVAESTLGMMIWGLKQFSAAERLTQAGGWKADPWATTLNVRELFELRVGLVGASAVGRHVIRLLRAFEVSVVVYDPHLSPEEADRLGVASAGLETLMSECDVVSLHAPALPGTRHMIGAAQLARMKRGALLVNTARGSLIDEAALTAALREGRISAILDVTDPEPPRADHPFRQLPNCVITPHLAGSVADGCRRLGRSVVDQLLAFDAGRALPGFITQERIAVLG